jgi:hypothetical protein
MLGKSSNAGATPPVPTRIIALKNRDIFTRYQLPQFEIVFNQVD